MDKKEALKIVQESGSELGNLPEEFKKDKDVVYAAMVEDGDNLEFADDSLKKDKKIILPLVKDFTGILCHVGESLKSDREVVLAAVINDASNFKFVDDSLRKDKEFVLDALKKVGGGDSVWIAEYADDSLKKDKEVVLEAVKQDGSNLQYADDSLKKDKEIVLEAVKQDGSVLFNYADDSLKKDKKIILEAIKKKHSLLQYADESLQKEIDPTFLYSKSDMTGSELNYDEFSINEKDINSTEKIKDFFSDDRNGAEYIGYIKGLECDPHDASEAGLLLGTISENDKNKLASLDVSIDDRDVDFSNIKVVGGGANQPAKPAKGEICLAFYYYLDASYKLETFKKNKKFCLDVESFGNLAMAPNDNETQEFEYALQGTGSVREEKWQIVFDDGKIIECDSDRNELIESISKYLISKGVFNK